MKIDDSSIIVPPYDGPNKTKLKDKRLSPEQVEAMLAKLFEGEQAESEET